MTQERMTVIKEHHKTDLLGVFATEHGLEKTPAVITTLHASRSGDGFVAERSQVLIWDQNKQLFLPAKDYDGFLGLEFVGRPADWSRQLESFQRLVAPLDRGAGEALSAIEADRLSREETIPQSQKDSHDQPLPRINQEPLVARVVGGRAIDILRSKKTIFEEQDGLMSDDELFEKASRQNNYSVENEKIDKPQPYKKPLWQ